MKNNFFRTSTAIFAVIIAACLGFTVSFYYLNSKISGNNERIKSNYEFITKVLKVDELIRGGYIGDVSDTNLIDGMITGYISELGDPFASYIRKSGYKSYLKYAERGTVSSTGLVVLPDSKGNLVVSTVIPNSPAWSAGFNVGDVIQSVNGSTVEEFGAYSILGKLVISDGESIDVVRKSKNGSVIISTKLSYNSKYSAKSVDFSVISVGDEYIHSADNIKYDSILYIDVRYFDDTTAEQIQNIITDAAFSKLPIILDLRNNAGGNAENLQKIADIFIPSGILFKLSPLDKNDEDNSITYYSDQNELTVPVCVLINEFTSREAEVLTLILKEYEKCSIVGSKSAGIGKVQSLIDLGDETAIYITTREYTLQKNTQFIGIGITPTYEVSGTTFDYNRLKQSDDVQLQTALGIFGFVIKPEQVIPEMPEIPETDE